MNSYRLMHSMRSLVRYGEAVRLRRNACLLSTATRLRHVSPVSHHTAKILLVAAASLPLVLSSLTETTRCDQEEEQKEEQQQLISENPLWPSGVSSEMVNRYVDEILLDDAINMRSVPDPMERIIYVSTVRLTLNTVYETLSTWHGTEILGHSLVLERNVAKDENDATVGLDFEHSTKKVDFAALQALADELLKYKAINQRWIPDVLERQVYANCLMIVFTILDKVADSLSFRMCGHELSLSFEPLAEAQKVVKRQRSDLEHPHLDSSLLDALVEQTVQESQDSSPLTAAISYLPLYETFLKALHKTLYSLILGIVDDLLSKTEIRVLEEKIHIKLVPGRQMQSLNHVKGANPQLQSALEQELEACKVREARAKKTAGALALVSLASIAAAVTSRRS